MTLFSPRQAVNPLPTGQHYPHTHTISEHSMPDAVAAHQVCGCEHHEPVPAPTGNRPQIHLTTGGLLVVVIGGITLTVTIGVVLTSLLLAVAVVAGALAMTSMALAVVAMAVKSMATHNPNAPTGKRRK